MATKGTTPRKAAKRNVENAAEDVYDAAEKLVDEVTGDADEQERDVPAPEPAPQVDEDRIPSHPYGDKKVYVYRPKDGSAAIVIPHITEVKPTQKFFWTIYRLNEMFQSFEWLNLAKIPNRIQEQIMDLGEKDIQEQADFFRGWFAPISRPQEGLTPPGES